MCPLPTPVPPNPKNSRCGVVVLKLLHIAALGLEQVREARVEVLRPNRSSTARREHMWKFRLTNVANLSPWCSSNP